MDIKREIEQFAKEKDKPILFWLFQNYHFASQWQFVANYSFERYGKLSYQTNRIWRPTKEGIILYNHRDELV